MQCQQRVLANNKRQWLGGATLFTNRFQRLDGVGGGGAVQFAIVDRKQRVAGDRQLDSSSGVAAHWPPAAGGAAARG